MSSQQGFSGSAIFQIDEQSADGAQEDSIQCVDHSLLESDESNHFEPIQNSHDAKPKYVKGGTLLAQQQSSSYGNLDASKLYEYTWPTDSKMKWFLQEQLSEFLQISSFKRKYPELTRRTVEMNERSLLIDANVISEQLAELGLTAIPALEVLNLLASDFPDKDDEYKKVQLERRRQEAIEKQKEIDMIKNDSAKVAEIRKKAMKSANEWNKDLNKERLEHRKGYLDANTMIVQVPKHTFLTADPETTRPGAYPVALIPDQFTNHVHRIEISRLSKLPINTVLDISDVILPKRPRNLLPVSVSEDELNAHNNVQNVKTVLAPPVEVDVKITPNAVCFNCKDIITAEARATTLQCAQCTKYMHAACIGLHAHLVGICRAYDWMCTDCKPCSVCSKIDQEDMMMFCDRCDRGYHTFCVGLNDLPEGTWLCDKFCKGESIPPPIDDDENSRSNQAFESCKQCRVQLDKDTRPHHKSKYRDAGLCKDCVKALIT